MNEQPSPVENQKNPEQIPPIHDFDEKIGELVDYAFRPIETDEDLRGAIEFLKLTNPELSGRALELLETKGVPISVGEVKTSRAEKSLYSLLNRGSAYASEVIVRKGASIYEVVHEVTHAVPLRELPQPLAGIDPIKVDTNQSVEDIARTIVRIGHLEEAVSLASEVELARSLEAQGITTNFDELAPGIRDTYERGGVDALAEELTDLIPWYGPYFEKMAERSAPMMKKPVGELMNVPWGDYLDEYGVDVDQKNRGQASVAVDTEQLRSSIMGTVANATPDKVDEAVSQLVDRYNQFVKDREARFAKAKEQNPPEELVEIESLKFEARPIPETITNKRIQTEPDKSQYRVEVAGQYHHFIESSMSAEQEPDSHFDDRLKMAEAYYGDRSAKVYQTLHHDALLDHQDTSIKPDRLRKLGISLLKSGYLEQGQSIIEHYLVEHNQRLSLEDLVGLAQELVDYDQQESISRIIGIAEERIARRGNLLDVFIDAYNGYGSFTEQAIQDLKEHFGKRVPTTNSMHEYVLSLAQNGGYVTDESWGDMALERPLGDHYQERYYVGRVKLAEVAVKFSGLAEKLGSQAELHSRSYDLSRLLFRDSTEAAQYAYREKLENWSAQFKIPVDLQGQRAISRFVRGLENSPESNDDYDFSRYLRDDVTGVAYRLARDPYFFEQAVDLLEMHEGHVNVVEIFEKIADEHGDKLSPQQMSRLVDVWNRSLIQACEDLESIDFIQEGSFASKQHRQHKYRHDNGVRPDRITDIHFYQEQRLAMAKMLLGSEDESQRSLGREMLESIPANKTHFFNPHEFISPKNYFFSEPSGYTIHTIHEFDQREFKVHALTEGARLDADNADAWLNQAIDLLGQIDIDPSTEEKFRQFENVLGRHYEVFDLLLERGRLDDAMVLYRRMERASSGTALVWANKVKAIEAMSQRERDNLPMMEDFYTTQTLKDARFWEQDIYSRTRAKLSKLLAQQGEFDEALAIAQDLSSSFDREVSGRRDRFDVRSMIISARQFADVEGLEDYGIACFEMSISKLSLSRGDENVFNSGIKLLFENIDQSKLDIETRDALLSRLIQQMSPGKNSEWREMEKSIPSLLSVARAISEAGIYPQADLEAIKTIHGLAMEASFSRDGHFGNYAKLQALQSLYGFISENYPEVFVSEFGDELADLSDEADYRSFLLKLHPELSERLFNGSLVEDGFFNLEKIKNGFYDRDELYQLLEVELHRLVELPDLAQERGEHLMQVYQVAVQHELLDFRNQKDKYYKPTLVDIDQIRGILFLKERFEQASLVGYDSTDLEVRAVQALLHADDQEEAVGKTSLYVHFLGEQERKIEVQRIAFEGLIKAKISSDYLTNFYEESVLGLDEEHQRQFFGLMKRFLSHKSGMPSDRILVQLLEYTPDVDGFLAAYFEANDKGTVPEELEERNYKDRLGTFFNGSERDYLEMRARIAQRHESWIPSLESFDDLVVAYDKRFNWFMNFPKFIESVRGIYVYDSFDVVGPHDYKYTHSAQQVIEHVQRVAPQIRYGQDQLDMIKRIFEVNKGGYSLRDKSAVMKITSERGHISYKQLIDYVFPDLELSRSQRDELIDMLHRSSDDSELEILFRTFGPANLSEEQKVALNNLLNEARETYIEQRDKTTQIRVETPPVFDEMPEVVQFALKRFFIQLPYGERQAVMEELDASTKGMTPQVAIRRFFEVTGSEKIGQFLSTRRDLIPEDYRHELERFQEDVEPSAFDEVRSTIEAELGQSLDDAFSEFSDNPINVGTVGEVYEARLASGEKVAVKVITPSKRRMINQMLQRLEKVCSDMEQNKSRFPGAYDPMSMFREFKRTMNIETDFRLEYQSAESIRRRLSKGVTIPKYYSDMVRESVLVQTFVEGVHIDLVDQPRIKLQALDKLGAMLLDQLLDTGEFHDDLHPGNVRIILKNGDVEVLDFGRVGRLTDEERKFMLPLLVATRTGQAGNFVELIETVSTRAANFDKFGLVQSVQKIINEGNGNMSVMISRMFLECGKHGLEVNSSYLQVLKAVMTFEGTARQLDPDFNFEQFLFRLGKGRMMKMLGNWLRS